MCCGSGLVRGYGVISLLARPSEVKLPCTTIVKHYYWIIIIPIAISTTDEARGGGGVTETLL